MCESCRSRQELFNEDLLAKIGVDTAENEPLKVHLIIQPRDLIFTEPPRPVLTALLVRCRRAGDDNLRIALRAG